MMRIKLSLTSVPHIKDNGHGSYQIYAVPGTDEVHQTYYNSAAWRIDGWPAKLKI